MYRATCLSPADAGEKDAVLAVKILDAEGRHAEPQLQYHLRNILRMQRLSHPNIVRVFGLAQDGNVSFATMEWLDGETLADLLDRDHPSPCDAHLSAKVVATLGSALQYAHDAGAVHGDLKPANVHVTESGDIKLLDFTFAGEPSAAGRQLTPEYASCEQLEGGPGEPSDDVYAFACLIYRMLSGQRPFADLTALEAEAAGRQPVRPQRVNDRAWDALRTALSFRRDRRQIRATTWRCSSPT